MSEPDFVQRAYKDLASLRSLAVHGAMLIGEAEALQFVQSAGRLQGLLLGQVDNPDDNPDSPSATFDLPDDVDEDYPR